MTKEMERWRLIAEYAVQIHCAYLRDNHEEYSLTLETSTELADEVMKLYPSEEEPKDPFSIQAYKDLAMVVGKRMSSPQELTARELVERMEAWHVRPGVDYESYAQRVGARLMLEFARKEAGINE